MIMKTFTADGKQGKKHSKVSTCVEKEGLTSKEMVSPVIWAKVNQLLETL